MEKLAKKKVIINEHEKMTLKKWKLPKSEQKP